MADAFVRERRGVEPAGSFDEVWLPGERSVEVIRSADAVDVDEVIWDELVALLDWK